MSDMLDVETWADRFALFGDLNRLTLVLTLRRRGSVNVSELASTTGIKMASVSHALRLLRAHGLVAAQRDGRMIRYTLVDHRVNSILDHVLQSTATAPGRLPGADPPASLRSEPRTR